MHTKVRGNFDHSLAFDMSWNGAAEFGCEELLGALQHLKDLTHVGEEPLPLQICKE